MLNCRDVSRLISQSMDARLPWRHRLAVRLHLLYCVWCRRYAAQLQFLRRAMQKMAATPEFAEDQKLSSEAKARMRGRLQQALDRSSPPFP
ncbi:conserved hypothetical protein [Verrucomicrobia bacterium]|nr:conserved hypothetical protein [Verrucomicrobiota bacterium]